MCYGHSSGLAYTFGFLNTFSDFVLITDTIMTSFYLNTKIMSSVTYQWQACARFGSLSWCWNSSTTLLCDLLKGWPFVTLAIYFAGPDS
jgi:hypothetical protein